jgi:hypothetical protein
VAAAANASLLDGFQILLLAAFMKELSDTDILIDRCAPRVDYLRVTQKIASRQRLYLAFRHRSMPEDALRATPLVMSKRLDRRSERVGPPSVARMAPHPTE